MLLILKLYHHTKLQKPSEFSLVVKPPKFIRHHIDVTDLRQSYSYRGEVPSKIHDIHTLTEFFHQFTYEHIEDG